MLFCGSIISAVHGNAFSAYCNESEVFPKVFTGNLLRLRSEQTAKLLRRPRSAKLWIRRARTHLQLHYPELVISDAHKALAIVSATSTSTDKNDKSRSKAAVLLCQGLLFAQCFQECLDHVQDFRARSRDHGITVLPDYLKELRKVAKYARQCLADVIAQEGDLHATVYGEILAGGYPWLEDHQKRTEETQLDMNEQLLKISDSACEIRKSHGARAVAGNCLGIFARHDIDEDEVIFKERPMLLATDYVDLDCCRFCCAPLDAYEAKPATKGCCSAKCFKEFVSIYGNDLATKLSATRLLAIVKQHMSPICDLKQLSYMHLVARALLSIVHQVLKGQKHPLDTAPISQLVGTAAAPRPTAFSYREDVRMPLAVLQAITVDVFSDLDFDMDVLLTIAGRLDLNSWEDGQEMGPLGEMFITGINSCYSLFNHSCQPNVTWMRDEASGHVIMTANRDIKADEELLISYLQDEQLRGSRDERMAGLTHWFGNGGHFCSRCFPEDNTNPYRTGLSFNGKRKRRSTESEGEGLAMTKRPRRSIRSLRSQLEDGMVFESLPNDYASGSE